MVERNISVPAIIRPSIFHPFVSLFTDWDIPYPIDSQLWPHSVIFKELFLKDTLTSAVHMWDSVLESELNTP
jgi:hypothetical protein